MIRVLPHRRDAQFAEVTFTPASNGLVGEISVLGDFNEWNPRTHPLCGCCPARRTTVLIPTGRRYAFRYLAAGDRWFNDEAAHAYQSNPCGGFDSVLDLTRTEEP